jgi:hypothetical protein
MRTIALLLLALVIVGCGGGDEPPRQSTTTTRLVSDSGTGNGVSADFTVPAGCNRQLVEYEATSEEPGEGLGLLHIWPFTVDGERADVSVSSPEVDEQPSGSGYWSLPPGEYYAETDVRFLAEWRYSVTCR